MSLKDRLYQYFVRDNELIRNEYEKYVIDNIEEHNSRRVLHWFFLFRLTWHYRIMRRKTPVRYFVNDESQKRKEQSKEIEQKKDGNVCKRATEIAQHSAKNKSQKRKEQSKEIEQKKDGNVCKRVTGFAQPEKEIIIREAKDCDVVSFDMFDTLVFRCVEKPVDVFRLIGNKLGIPNFINIRREIEKELRGEEEREITISEIYALVEKRFGVPANEGIDTEIEYEMAVVMQNPYIKKIYDELLNMGKRIIVCSNMYLSSDVLRTMLYKCGYDKIDNVFVSCELGCSKKMGELQKKVTEIIGGDEKDFLHIGDNYFMDIEGSRIAGWKTIHYKNVTRIGAKSRPPKMSTVAGSIYKGLVNQKLYCGEKLDSYYEYGYAYVGFLIFGFCRWLQDLSKKLSIDKLLFASRDMYVVYKLFSSLFDGCDSEYIKASRTSSIHLSFDRHIEHFFDWHLKRRLKSNSTISQVLEELNYSFLSDDLNKYELSSNEILSENNYELMKKMIYDNKEQILEQYEDEKKAAYKYYKDVIGDKKNICIVDLGWKASTYSSLKEFLIIENKMDIKLYSALIGMEGHDFVDEMMSNGEVYAYVFSNYNNIDLMKTHNKNGNIWRRLYEIIFTSNEKSLLKFGLNDDGNVEFHYLREEQRNPNIVSNIHKGALDFAMDYYKAEQRLNKEYEISPRDAYIPLQQIFFDNNYNLELFSDFEVCFIAGDIRKDNVEVFADIVK